MFEVSVWSVFIAALLTALATGLGALPFLAVKDMSRHWLGLSNAIAAGLMLSASFGLIYEGIEFSALRTVIGVLLGVALIAWAHRFIHNQGHISVGELKGADAKKAILIIGIMFMHSMAEGIGVGVAYGDGDDLGVFITAAIAVHNIPEGLAIALVMIPRGTSVAAAAGWSIFSSLPQPVLAVPAFLFVLAFEPFLPIGLGLAAGAMIWMSFAELVPEANDDAGHDSVAIALTLSIAAMIAFQELILR
ncbi:MAG: ZIP family metal transporter [Geminicoccaceae bacterium]